MEKQILVDRSWFRVVKQTPEPGHSYWFVKLDWLYPLYATFSWQYSWLPVRLHIFR